MRNKYTDISVKQLKLKIIIISRKYRVQIYFRAVINFQFKHKVLVRFHTPKKNGI